MIWKVFYNLNSSTILWLEKAQFKWVTKSWVPIHWQVHQGESHVGYGVRNELRKSQFKEHNISQSNTENKVTQTPQNHVPAQANTSLKPVIHPSVKSWHHKPPDVSFPVLPRVPYRNLEAAGYFSVAAYPNFAPPKPSLETMLPFAQTRLLGTVSDQLF